MATSRSHVTIWLPLSLHLTIWLPQGHMCQYGYLRITCNMRQYGYLRVRVVIRFLEYCHIISLSSHLVRLILVCHSCIGGVIPLFTNITCNRHVNIVCETVSPGSYLYSMFNLHDTSKIYNQYFYL